MLGRTSLFPILLLTFWAAVPANAQTTANLWIDTTGGTCTRQSSPGPYVQAQACASMQAAQTAAQSGDTVIIKNGTYGGQALSSGQKTSAVSYYAETAGFVLLTGDLSIGIDHVHITGVISAGAHETRHQLSVDGGSGSTSWVDVLVDGFHGRNLWVAASGVTIQNSEFGDADECLFPNDSVEDATRLWSSNGTPSNFKFLHNTVHDWYKHNTSCDSNHVDGFQNYAGSTNVLFDGNKFYNNDTSNFMTEGVGGSWVVQNNYFGPPVNGGNNLTIGRGDCSGIVIQNNAIDFGTFNNEVSCTSGLPTIRSNIAVSAMWSCNVVGGTFDHNIFPVSGGITCGSSSKRCAPTWLNGLPSSTNNYDIRLSSSDTCAKDAGNVSSYPATDMYGSKRPQGLAPDAGPFEILSVGSTVAAPGGLTAAVR